MPATHRDVAYARNRRPGHPRPDVNDRERKNAMRHGSIDAAIGLIADHGAEQLMLDGIAATDGITVRQLRAYFTSPTAIRVAAGSPQVRHDVWEGGDVRTHAELVA